MEHNDIRHRLSDYLDESITAEEKVEIEEHLKTCQQCSGALNELRKTVEHIKRVEEVEPPDWMTQKIMATVRAEAEKRSLFQRLFYPLAIKLPIQAVVVVFLAVTAFSLYRNIQPAQTLPEAPMQEFAVQQEAPQMGGRAKDHTLTRKLPDRLQQVPQSPGYKALDMKLEYEKPAPPKPAVPPVPRKKEAAVEERFAAPQAGAAPLQREPAEQATGAAPQAESKRKDFVKTDIDAAPGKTEIRQEGIAEQVESNSEDMKTLIQHFTNHDLPKNMIEKGLSFSTYKVHENLPNLQWIEDTTRKALASCTRKYMIDVKRAEKKQMYFYCLDNSTTILLNKYELINGKWIAIK